jgi:glutamyl-tRNA reductase
MDRIAVAGLSIHEADVTELEALSSGAASVEDLLRELADELAASELVLLRTCNRTELFFARESGAPPSSLDRDSAAQALGIADDRLRVRLHLHRGRSAVRHLFRVVSSLESLVVGEDQILAQVRAAHARSRAVGLTGPLLEPVFEAALQVGKRVRTATDLCRHPVSVVALGIRALREEPWAEEARPRIAVVGAGRTGRLAGLALRDQGWPVDIVVNRSPGPAAELAQELGARPLSLMEFRAGCEPVDVVVTATNAPGFVLDADALGRVARPGEGRRLVGIDLALPRDLEPVDDDAFRIIDLECLRERAEENKRSRRAAALEAESIVERKLESLARRTTERRLEGIVGEILAETGEVLEHELRALPTGRLSALDEEDRRAVERWARRTFGRLAHAPLAACKRLSHHLHDLFDDTDEVTIG